MSNDKSNKRKVVVTTKKNKANSDLKPTASRLANKSNSGSTTQSSDLIFGVRNFKMMLIGVGLITLGMLLMLGGNMPSPDVWDEDLIYGFRRTVLAPILILAGFIVEVYAILIKK